MNRFNVYQIKKENVKCRYAVLFNLDKSGSMMGSKWRNVCNAVETFIQNMGEEDIVACITFNDIIFDGNGEKLGGGNR